MIEHEPYCEWGHTAAVTCLEVAIRRKERRQEEAAKPKVPPDVAFELTQYERDNLLALLGAIVSPHGKSPLSRAHNGDWTLQVAYKLGYMGDKTDWGQPNRTAAQLIEDANK